MRRTGRWIPLAWGLGITTGALLATIVSPYVPGWGVALAPPAAVLLFAIGSALAPEDALPATVLRVSVALTIGFLAASIAITLAWLAEVPERSLALEEAVGERDPDDARVALLRMWTVMGFAVVIGVAGLLVRRRREKLV